MVRVTFLDAMNARLQARGWRAEEVKLMEPLSDEGMDVYAFVGSRVSSPVYSRGEAERVADAFPQRSSVPADAVVDTEALLQG